MTRRTPRAMSNLVLARAAMALMLVGAGCAALVEPTPAPPTPKPPDPEQLAMERKRESARFQQELVMEEVGRTHPVLSATLDRSLPKLQAAIAKTPAKVNEVRRDLRLGPPLREACRLRWKEGISELLDHGAKCLGDSQCESCVRAQGGSLGGSSPFAPRPAQTTPGQTTPGPMTPRPTTPGQIAPRQTTPGTLRPLP